MKKITAVLMCMALLFSLAACSGDKGDATANNKSESTAKSSQAIDVDLTKLSSTMVYAEVNNMMQTPENYLGKRVKMKGNFSVYTDKTTGKNYFAVLIADATACCQQGLEFSWLGDHSYPKDFPEIGTEIEVTGLFDTYDENGQVYCQLITDSGYTVC